MRTAADMMQPARVRVGPSDTLQRASAAMLDARAHEAVVEDHGRLIGVLTVDGIAEALGSRRRVAEATAADLARNDAPVIRAGLPLVTAHMHMRRARCPLAVVVDARRRPIGLLLDPEAGPGHVPFV